MAEKLTPNNAETSKRQNLLSMDVNTISKKSKKVSEWLRLKNPIFESSRDNERGLESKIVTGRTISSYERALHFSRELLRGKTVLNFGCGGSNIGPKLQESNVDANIVDLDLKFDPVGGNFAVPIVKAIDYVRSKLDQSGKPYEKLTKARRYVGGIEDRKFIQGDGRNLPFADETFDMSMALWSTYQIPDGAKESVFREIMRVSNTIHLGPIFKKDYELLQSLAEELNFEIVVCHPFTIASEIRSLEEMDPLLKIDGVRSEFETFLSKVSKTVEEDNFKAQKDADYQNYINQNEVDKRIVKPKEENSKVVRIFDVPVLATGEGSSFMVLRRKKE